MLVDALLSPAPLLVLDEAFDGLDQSSMQELHKMVLDEVRSTGQRKRAMMLITHREEDLDTPPSHVLLLGQGATRTSYRIGDWNSPFRKAEGERREHLEHQGEVGRY